MGRLIKSPVSAKIVAKTLSADLDGADIFIYGVSALESAGEYDLCFLKSEAFLHLVRPNTVVITSKELSTSVIKAGAIAIKSINPRLDFALALNFLDKSHGFVWSDKPPLIHPTAVLGINVALGRGVKLGANTKIGNNVVIGDEVVIGHNCNIKSSAVIGEDGFGYERSAEGIGIRFPHIGGVTIGDNVEIGALTTVCRGTLSNTIIKDGAKIDDHVHIAHNVTVGNHSFVIACAEVSGGVKIGDFSWISPCVAIKNQITVGSHALVGMGSVVLRDVLDRQVVVGNPAKPLVNKAIQKKS